MIDKEEIKSLFAFTKRENRGLFLLLLLIMFFVMIRFFLPAFIPNDESPGIKLSILTNNQPAVIQTGTYDEKTGNKQSYKLFAFDPNTVATDELITLGFSEFAASNMIKYRNNGGKFYKKADLLKIYGIDSSFLNKIAPFIVINLTEDVKIYSGKHIVNRKSLIIELNSSGSERLKSIYGIGDVLSKRIVRYRELLGGYYTVEQVKEVYGISDSLFQSISDHMVIDTLGLKKININELSETELALHPYITNYEARSIVKFREYVGNINSLRDLTLNYLLSEDKFRKLRPYLTL